MRTKKNASNNIPALKKTILSIVLFIIIFSLATCLFIMKSHHLAGIRLSVKPVSGKDADYSVFLIKGKNQAIPAIDGETRNIGATGLWIQMPSSQKDNIENLSLRIGSEIYSYDRKSFYSAWKEIDADELSEVEIMQGIDDYNANRPDMITLMSPDEIKLRSSFLPGLSGLINYKGDPALLFLPLLISIFACIMVILILENRISSFISINNTLLFLLLYTVIASFLLPHGINSTFASLLKDILIIFVIIGAFAYPAFLKRSGRFSFVKGSERLKIPDFIFLLIPLTPIMQYIFLNQKDLSIKDSILAFMFFALISAVFCIGIPVLFSAFASKIILITVSSGFLYIIFNMTALSAGNKWVGGRGQFEIQLAVLLITILVLLLGRLLPKSLFNTAVIAFFLVNTLAGFQATGSTSDTPEEIREPILVKELGDREPVRENHIFLLVFEAYANFETMLHYGFDNSDQLAYLEEKGFNIYDSSYSLGPCTLTSMSRVLSIDNSPAGNPRSHIVGGIVTRLLGKYGYKTYCRTPNNYLYRGLEPGDIKYDFYYPELVASENLSIIINAILEGEFRHTAGFAEFETTRYHTYLENKRYVLKNRHRTPVFMYSHSGVPGHSQSSGKCLPDEKFLYFAGIKKANEEMKEDIETVIQNNPDAIVIVAGDHGPYLTKNCASLVYHSMEEIDRYDVQDRYGQFLAIRWPEKEYSEKLDIRVFQDIMPAVLAWLYDDPSLFDTLRIQDRIISDRNVTGQVYVDNGMIVGGLNDGEPLFNDPSCRSRAHADIVPGSNAVISLADTSLEGTYLWSYDEDRQPSISADNSSWERISEMVADRLKAGNITGDQLPEIVGTFPGHGLWYYSFSHNSWINILGNAYTFGDFALIKKGANGKEQIFISLEGLGLYLVESSGQYKRILPVTADSVLSGRFSQSADYLFIGVAGKGNLDGLYVYNAGIGEFTRIVKDIPLQMASADINGDGYDEIICAFRQKGTYTGMFSPSEPHKGNEEEIKKNPEFILSDGIALNHKFSRLIGLEWERILKDVPGDRYLISSADIVSGNGKEIFLTHSNATYYYVHENRGWVKFTKNPLEKIISGKFTKKGQHDDLIAQDRSNNGIFLYMSSSGKWEQIAPSGNVSAMQAF